MRRDIEEDRWSELRRRLCGFVGRRVRNPQEAEDVVQDIFVRIHRNIGALSSAERLDAWAFQIARNAITDYYRSANRREASGEVAAKAEESAIGCEGDELPTDARDNVTRCITSMVRQLPEGYRKAIELTEFEGLTQTAAAKRLGLSVAGTKSRVQRGRARLRTMILHCCEIETDRRGRVVAFETRDGEGYSACSKEGRGDPGRVTVGCLSERSLIDS